ncbi:MAG: hypothetical protein DLM67_24330, partial [Candidatus Nephthysia bennettiae]
MVIPGVDIADYYDRLGPLKEPLLDDRVSEVMVNGKDQIFVEIEGRIAKTGLGFPDEESLVNAIQFIAGTVGRHVDERTPLVDCRLVDGSRVNAVLRPVAIDGPSLTIRKFATDPYQVEDLIRFGTCTESGFGFLKACVHARANIIVSGGTGTGKTTTALRVVAARALADRSAVLAIDQKGDEPAERALRYIAAAAGVPFILIDPRARDTDRWQPISGTVGEVVARAVEPIKASEEYYSDMLRLYLAVVAGALEHAGYWPPSLPFLIDSCQLTRLPRVRELCTFDDDLSARITDAEAWISTPDGRRAVAGGVVRLQIVMGEAWRPVLAPRVTPTGEHVAVSLARAIEQRAVVLWRTYVDDMPKEAAMITVLALADMYAAAQVADAPWTLLLDEFGGVMHIAAERALAMLQRGRSHNGQVIVVTQSAADPEALTGQTGLLASLTDNFTGFAIHRQNAPETRDWLAKLMGTRALWQHTDQTTGHGFSATGTGSRRRVREFRVGSDEFA